MQDDISAALDFLEGQREISQRVTANWEVTTAHRLHLLLDASGECLTLIRRTGKCHVNSYFNKYPFLRQPEGYQLVIFLT